MPATASPLPLTAAIDDFLVALRAGKPSPHTVRAYRADVDGVSAILVPSVRDSVADLPLPPQHPLTRTFLE